MEYFDIPYYIVKRVMKENLWSENYTLRVVEEYKKFIYLTTQMNAAPSFEIDQVWHAHMLFSKDYEKMEKIIDKRIYHQPNTEETVNTSGKDDYLETKLAYMEKFNRHPPIDIWTTWKKSNYVHLDLTTHWVTPEGDWKALVKILFKYLKSKIYEFI